MAKKEYSYKFEDCDTEIQAMNKLKSKDITIKKLADGELNMISFEAYEKKKGIRFFGIIHKKTEEEKGIYVTGEFELVPIVKAIVTAIAGILAIAVAVLTFVQCNLAEGLKILYTDGTNPVFLPAIQGAAVILCIAVLLWLVIFVIWQVNEPYFEGITSEVERLAKQKKA